MITSEVCLIRSHVSSKGCHTTFSGHWSLRTITYVLAESSSICCHCEQFFVLFFHVWVVSSVSRINISIHFLRVVNIWEIFHLCFAIKYLSFPSRNAIRILKYNDTLMVLFVLLLLFIVQGCFSSVFDCIFNIFSMSHVIDSIL